MSKKLKILNPKNNFDMVPWCYEKTFNVLQNLVFLKENLDELYRKISDKEKPENSSLSEIIDSTIFSAMYDQLKLLSFFAESDWSPNDAEIIFKNGNKGFEEILVKYGIKEETTEAKEKRLFLEVIENIEEYLKLDRYPGRQMIFNTLSKYKNEYLKRIEYLTEEVTMGDISWEEYKKKVLNEIQYIRNILQKDDLIK